MQNYQHIIDGSFEYYYRPAKNVNKQTIVFCHGYATFFDYYNSYSDQLSDNDYFAIVLPGHGTLPYKNEMLKVSYYAKHLTDFINKLNLKRIILMGHSMGAAVSAAATNLLEKDIVDKLIIISPMNLTSILKGTRFKTTFKIKPKKIEKSLYRFSKCLYFDKKSPYDNSINGKELLEKEIKYYSEHVKSFDLLNKQMTTFKELRFIVKNYKNLKVKTFLILGEKDKILPVKLTIKKLKNDINDLTYVQLLRTGHLLFIERPVDYFNLMNSIIESKSIKNIY
ncbi:alpha/beta fold hydrolase [Mycoplasmoides pirum]|uniref:alpha/beta fold hydrolase n=1 Tax=Mycoplasmoides pirum TaxID=2122 RepID=UPI00048774F0|nr:alpha/beta hydrolase [Mycoplasmoides pirum]